MNYHLIALDMDGTLLNRNLEIHPDIIESMHRAKVEGKEIVMTVKAGDKVKIALEMERMHFFDKDTERCIVH